LSWELQGTQGTITYNQERLNELNLYTAQKDNKINGFKNILTGPEHPFYSAFLPNGGHSLGFMDVKMCELQTLLIAIENNKATWPDFCAGYAIEKVMETIDRSAIQKKWLKV